jgi:hypothetical protein
MAQLSYLAATASPQAIAAAVTRDGAVVLERVIDPYQAQAALDELLPFSQAAPVGRDKDSGYRTTWRPSRRRVCCRRSWRLVASPAKRAALSSLRSA